MGQQEARGKVTELKGRVKEAVGILADDKALEQEGSRERVEGAVQEGLGRARRKVGEYVEGIAKTIKK